MYHYLLNTQFNLDLFDFSRENFNFVMSFLNFSSSVITCFENLTFPPKCDLFIASSLLKLEISIVITFVILYSFVVMATILLFCKRHLYSNLLFI